MARWRLVRWGEFFWRDSAPLEMSGGEVCARLKADDLCMTLSDIRLGAPFNSPSKAVAGRLLHCASGVGRLPVHTGLRALQLNRCRPFEFEE